MEGVVEGATSPPLPPKVTDRMQQDCPPGRGGEGEVEAAAAARRQSLQVVPDGDSKPLSTEIPPIQGGEGFRDHTYLPLLPDEVSSPPPSLMPHQKHGSAFGRLSVVIPESLTYASPPAPVYSNAPRLTHKAVGKQRTMSEDDSAIELDTSKESSLESIAKDNPAYPSRENPAYPSRENPAYPSRENPAYPSQRTRPTPQERTRPTPQERTRPTPQERTQPTPQERTQPTPQERTQPTPQERTQPTPQERTRPTPQERTRPTPQERTQPTPQERTQPTPQERTQPTPQERTQPTPQERTQATVYERLHPSPQ